MVTRFDTSAAVGYNMTVADSIRQLTWWPQLRARRAWLALALLLALGLLEPLACVLHCQFLIAQDAAAQLRTLCAYHPEPTFGQPGQPPARPADSAPQPYHETLPLAAALPLILGTARWPVPLRRLLHASWQSAPPTPVPIAG